jgi:hypothetical protein
VNSFTLNAVGNLARNPDFVAKNDMSYARFCLVGNDYAGKDEGGEAREVTTSLWFVAFGAMGEALARNARKGDQLVVQARVRANNWTDKQGEKQYDHSFVAREYQVILPAELDGPRRVALARAFAREIAERYKVAVDLAVHEPRPDADPRNFHAHLLTTTREITPTGLGAKSGLDMHAAERRRHGLPDHSQEFTNVRELWATLTNEALRDANIDARIDHRSLAAQGIDRVPQPAIPLMHLKMEQRGLKSGLADRLRAEYRDRIALRLEKAAARDAAATARDERRMAESTAAPRVADSDVEEIKRRAREAWLQFRAGEQQASNVQPFAKDQAGERDAREDDAAQSRAPQNDLAL